MFVRIEPNELVIGKKYKIGEHTGIFKRVAYRAYGYVFYSKRAKRYFAPSCTFYKFVSDNPQEKMERRAVNKIVQRLIGDDNFEW
jgi:hypothetical protein